MQQAWITKKLILIVGKGGVGKSLIADATARALASQGKRVLLCHVLQITESEQLVTQPDIEKYPTLSEITLNPTKCFSEYVHLKLKIPGVAKLLLNSPVIKYFEKAAPGVREMVLLGKLWFERSRYDHVVVDMPSTGYALTMLHTPFNYASLFPGGPIYNDSKQMMDTFSDPSECSIVAVSLPEEMPIQESIELAEDVRKLMPKNPSWLILNKIDSLTRDSITMFEKLNSKTSQLKSNLFWRALQHKISKHQTQMDHLKSLEHAWQTKDWIEIPEIPELSLQNRIEKVKEYLL